MAEPIGVGDFVECISADSEPLLIGAVYVVAEAHEPSGPCTLCGDAISPAVVICGVPMDPGIGYCATCEVRPVYRPKASLIQALKAPPKRAPKRQREDA